MLVLDSFCAVLLSLERENYYIENVHKQEKCARRTHPEMFNLNSLPAGKVTVKYSSLTESRLNGLE